MTIHDKFPGIVTDDSGPDPVTEMMTLARVHGRQLERAYKLGLLHGINAQSMAIAKEDVMEFEDCGWETND